MPGELLTQASGCAYEGSSKKISIWVSELSRIDCPECGWHHPTCCRPRWNKKVEGRGSLLELVLSLLEQVFFCHCQNGCQILGSSAFEHGLLLAALQGSSGLGPQTKLHHQPISCFEASGFMDLATTGFAGSPGCRQPLWDFLASCYLSQTNKSPLTL